MTHYEPAPQRSGDDWLSLGQASRALGVSESTLRRWADAGTIRSFRTPGGHRRFSVVELGRLTQGGSTKDGPLLGGEALRHIRARLAGDKEPAPVWFDGLSTDTRRALGELGRSTVELVGRAAASDAQADALAGEADRLGASYGRILGQAGLGLSDAVAAFSYFRTSVGEAVTTHAQAQGLPAYAAGGVWERVSHLEDGILVALTAEYERERVSTSGRAAAGNE